ncbi:MAG: inositol monophosphatase family protein [Actinomycetota bacterium]
MSEDLTAELRGLAEELARAAGEVLLDMAPKMAGSSGEDAVVETKSSPTDPVTEADRAAEAVIFERLRKVRPDDTIVAEEGSGNQGTTGIKWVIDPLDGTVNFVYGLPQWCVSIGIEGKVRLGVIYDPNRDEMFSDPSALFPGSKTHLKEALIGTGFAYSPETRARQAETACRLLPQVRDIRRAGSCALDLAWVACGRLDGFYEEGVQAWDTSAGTALVEAAGGSVGKRGDLTFAAGTRELREKLEKLVLEG